MRSLEFAPRARREAFVEERSSDDRSREGDRGPRRQSSLGVATAEHHRHVAINRTNGVDSEGRIPSPSSEGLCAKPAIPTPTASRDPPSITTRYSLVKLHAWTGIIICGSYSDRCRLMTDAYDEPRLLRLCHPPVDLSRDWIHSPTQLDLGSASRNIWRTLNLRAVVRPSWNRVLPYSIRGTRSACCKETGA